MSFECFVAAHGQNIVGDRADPFTFYQVYQDLVERRQVVAFDVLCNTKLQSSHIVLKLTPRQAELTVDAVNSAYKVIPVAADTPLQVSALLRMLEALSDTEHTVCLRCAME